MSLINKGSGTNLSTSRLVTHQENHTQMACRSRQLRQLCKQICQLAFANTSRSPSQRVTNDEDAVCSSQPGEVRERKPKGKRILQEKDRQMYALAREGAQLP